VQTAFKLTFKVLLTYGFEEAGHKKGSGGNMGERLGAAKKHPHILLKIVVCGKGGRGVFQPRSWEKSVANATKRPGEVNRGLLSDSTRVIRESKS